MKNKKILVLLLTSLLMPLSSCNFLYNNDDDLNFKTISTKFYNQSNEYKMNESTIYTFYQELDDGTYSDIPYVEVSNFLNGLEGFIDNSLISKKLSRIENIMRLTIPYVQNGYTFGITCDFDYFNNCIEVNNTGFFSLPIRETSDSNYASNLKVVNSSSTSGNYTREYYLNNYDMDIYYWKGKVLVPFSVMNLLFCSQNMYNVYFNGDAYYGVDYYLSSSDSYFSTIMTSSHNGQTPSKEFREFNYNFMCFAMGEFYGLKEYYGNTSSYYYESWLDNLLSEKTYYEDLKSQDPLTYTKAYLDFFRKDLDELHTAITTYTYYNPNAGYEVSNNGSLASYNGSFRTSYIEEYNSLLDYASQAFGNATNEDGSSSPNYEYLRYCDDTAIIHFDSFDVGTKAELESDTPWKYDTYELMKHCVEDISTKSNIKKVVIDLATNGGGSIAAMIKALGFFTTFPIPYSMSDTISRADATYYYKVTTNTNLLSDVDYYVLTSKCTYSAANYFAYTFKNMNIGKVIGQQSGGGMCAVFPMVLPDGTTIPMSGPTQLKILNNSGEYTEVQTGITPDIELENKDYYSSNIGSLIDSLS